MALTPTEVQAIATAEAAKFQYVSLHTADPGTTGASEATGGSPAYARKLSTWTASAGVVSGTQVTVDVPAGTYTHFGIWSALTGGTFYGGNPLLVGGTPTPQVVSSQGQIKNTPTLTVTAS